MVPIISNLTVAQLQTKLQELQAENKEAMDAVTHTKTSLATALETKQKMELAISRCQKGEVDLSTKQFNTYVNALVDYKRRLPAYKKIMEDFEKIIAENTTKIALFVDSIRKATGNHVQPVTSVSPREATQKRRIPSVQAKARANDDDLTDDLKDLDDRVYEIQVPIERTKSRKSKGKRTK